MQYKRTEYFRYTFHKPLPAEFKIIIENTYSKPGKCEIVDLSPKGAKLYSEFSIPVGNGNVHLLLQFTIYDYALEVPGKIHWRNEADSGFFYGFEFEENDETGNLITKELKLRRRAETEHK